VHRQRERRVDDRVIGSERAARDRVIGKIQLLPESRRVGINPPFPDPDEAFGRDDGEEALSDGDEFSKGPGPRTMLDLEAGMLTRGIQGQENPLTCTDREGSQHLITRGDKFGRGHGSSMSIDSSARTAHRARMRRTIRMRIMRTLNSVVLNARATSGEGSPWKV